jgi:hypothetical protein
MDNVNVPKLKIYGSRLLDEYNLVASRRSFVYDFELTYDNIKKFAESLLSLEIENMEIVAKSFGTTHSASGLKWHIDDCQLVTLKQPPIYNLDQYLHLEGAKYLYFNNKYKVLPKYTVLFYQSTQGIDFTGGELVLADDTKIIPCRGHGFALDSKESHMVLPIKSGVRVSTIVKIY